MFILIFLCLNFPRLTKNKITETELFRSSVIVRIFKISLNTGYINKTLFDYMPRASVDTNNRKYQREIRHSIAAFLTLLRLKFSFFRGKIYGNGKRILAFTYWILSYELHHKFWKVNVACSNGLLKLFSPFRGNGEMSRFLTIKWNGFHWPKS